jgi:hypothetical protein
MKRRGEGGAAAVEFALVVPILLAVVFGIVTYGLVFAQSLSLGNAARQGARFGVVADRTCGAIQAETQDAAATIGLSAADVTVTIERDTGGVRSPICGSGSDVPCKDSEVGDSIYVKTMAAVEPIVPLVPAPTQIDSEGVFRCEFS